jgi:hypothetical protein
MELELSKARVRHFYRNHPAVLNKSDICRFDFCNPLLLDQEGLPFIRHPDEAILSERCDYYEMSFHDWISFLQNYSFLR